MLKEPAHFLCGSSFCLLHVGEFCDCQGWFFRSKDFCYCCCRGIGPLLLTATGQSANAESAAVLSNGSYACSTGLPAAQGDTTACKITDDVVSDGTRCVGAVVIPEGVTSIGEGWFYRNYNLASITIPAGVTSIGTQAFNWAEKLRRVYFLGDAPTFIGDHVFDTVKGVAHAHITAEATGFPSPGSTWNYLVFDDAGDTPAALKATYVKGATLKGSAKVNKSITVSPGTWKGYLTVFYTYQWYSCTAASNKVLTTGKPAPKCKLIKGATKASLTVSKNLKGSFLGVLTTGTNSVGNSTVFTATVGKVS